MNNANNIKYIGYLFRFMQLFEINRFQLFEFCKHTIKARVGWGDDGSAYYDKEEEVQDIEWDIQVFDNIEDTLLLAEFIIDNNLISIDKIIISEVELYKRINWGKEKFDSSLKSLLNFRVDMVDEGKRTDYFFIHF
ncbi:MAG: hypothetical protein ACQ9MH_08785 [Nitrospinales bacterium]